MNSKSFLVVFVYIILSKNLFAQSDTLYIMKNGMIVTEFAQNRIDSIVFDHPEIDSHGTFMDLRDSNIYSTIIIGNQVWMAENLRYLPQITSTVLANYSSPCYFVHNYYGGILSVAKNSCNYRDYGTLYTHYSATLVCPPGWHLPSFQEYSELFNFLGGDTIAGAKMRVTGFEFWNEPNLNATNEVGFNLLPGGCMNHQNGTFIHIGESAYLWTSSEISGTLAIALNFWRANKGVTYTSYLKRFGLSVRCIQNN